jgi:branched-chain amino acid transport system permease protein
MQASLLLEQLLNGFQFGMTLFLMAAGLTLIFGIMNLINLAHGSLYMVGAYAAAWGFNAWHSALAFALAAATGVGVALELAVFRALYDRDPCPRAPPTTPVRRSPLC